MERRCRAGHSAPLQAAVSDPGQGLGTRDWGPGVGGDGRRRSSGQEEYWNRHPLGSCPLCNNRSSGSRGCAFPPLYFSWQRTGGLSGSTLQVMKLRSEKRRCLERPQRCPFRCTIGLLQKVSAYYPPRARPPSPPTLYVLIWLCRRSLHCTSGQLWTQPTPGGYKCPKATSCQPIAVPASRGPWVPAGGRGALPAVQPGRG